MIKRDLLKALRDHRGRVEVEVSTPHGPHYFEVSKAEVKRRLDNLFEGAETDLMVRSLGQVLRIEGDE